MDIQVTPEYGRIEAITGCMFSGKTEELIHRANRAQLANDNLLAFKPDIDDRYEVGEIVTHTDVSVEATPVKTDETGCEEIQKIVEESDNVDVIVIDEINFFSENIITLVEDLAQKDYRVILSGLDQTFRGEPFNPVPQLLSIADHIEKRQAVCEICGEPATKTQRLMDEKPAPYDSPTIDVGGEEKYEPRCRQCHDVPKS
jgi:thymidine kinase